MNANGRANVAVNHNPRRHRKSSAAQPHSWQEVNQRLGQLGEIERQLHSLRNQFEQRVAVLKQQWLEASQAVASEKKKLEEQIEWFYWAHREEVLEQGRKSVELAFGRLGSRRCRRLAVENAAAAQQWLEGHRLGHYVRVRTELDREALRSALFDCENGSAVSGSDLLNCPGIRLEDEEEFWYEADVTGRPPEEGLAAGGDARSSTINSAKESSPRALAAL